MHALKGVDLELLQRQKIMAVIGPNGAGKSTFHSLLSFAARRTYGEIAILGSEKVDIMTNVGIVTQ